MRLWAGLAFAVAVHVVLATSASAPQVHHGGDNAGYLSLAHSLVQDGSYREQWHPGQPEHSKYPPIYPAFLAAMILAGAKSWSVFKASSLALTALATAFCFLWGRRMYGDRAGLVAAVLFGASYAVLYSAQWILSEPLFLALKTACLWLLAPKRGIGEPQRTDAAPASFGPARWELAAGLTLAMAAYFTRAAGLPLVAAVALWLATSRRWKALAAFAAAAAGPLFLWHTRSGGEYVSEFWLINPYQPDLGQAGLGDLAARAATNAWLYAGDHIPNGLAGSLGVLAPLVGIALIAAVAVEWLRRVRSGPGVAEFFVVLYGGLMLAWPTQWAGDRFALPILPVTILYAYASAARLAKYCAERTELGPAAARRSGARTAARKKARAAARGRVPAAPLPAGLRRLAVVALVAAVAVPAGLSWDRLRATSPGCAEATVAGGPWGCYAPNIRALHVMALFAGDHLPEGSVVYSRKPRLFYAFSGMQSVAYPRSRDPSRFMAVADSLGVGYVARSRWDSSEAAFVDPAVAAYPERFCRVAAFGSAATSISLLAIDSRPAEGTDTRTEGEGARTEGEDADPALSRGQLRDCPPQGGSTVPSRAAVASMTVPILRRSEFR